MSMTPLEIALERIEECRRTRSTSLDLSSLCLNQIPEQAFELTWLKVLNCIYNQISDFSVLEHVPNLQMLFFSGNQISDLSILEHVPSLRMLYCFDTQVSDLSALAHVPNLRMLYCWNSQVSDLHALVYVPNLQTLSFDGNQISDLSALVHVPNLQELSFCGNQIGDLSPLVYIPNLQTLSFDGKHIRDLSALVHVPNLQELYLGNSQVSDLSTLVYVPNLRRLSFGFSKNSDLIALINLPNLQELHCGFSNINDLSPIYHLVMSGQLQGLYLCHTKVLGIPSGILGVAWNDNCVENLRNYWCDLAKGNETRRKLKVQFVGNGLVGKTTLAYALEHKCAPNEPFKSTHGIIIKEIQQPLDGEDEPVTLQLWDFGGQEIYHATHRLFLSDDCLYLLLWSEETEEHPDETRHSVSYWLELIHDLAPKSQVIVVKNQIDQFNKLPLEPLDLASDVPGYEQIREFVKISALKYQGMSMLEGAIKEVLRDPKLQVCLELPTSWLQVQRELKQLDQKTIPFAHFKQLCIKAGINHAQWFVDYLHKTGVLFYRKGAFQDQVILDQNWVIEAAYRVFDPKGHRGLLEQMRGSFKGAYTQIFWPDANETERNIYLDFMRNCGICYEPNRKHDTPFADRKFIIPALLPEASTARSAWHKNDKDWQLDIEYPFLHRSIIERIILRLGETYQGEPWRTGIFCETEYGKVLLECSYHDKKQSTQGQLNFHLHGNQLTPLVYALRKLVSEVSPHSRYQEFLQQGQTNRAILPEFKVAEESFSSRLDLIEPNKTIKLFISYSRVDREHKLTLEKHLRLIKEALKHQVKLDIWSDHLMDAGEGVNDQILPKLHSADLILLLVSPDFLDPERYSCGVELPIALERHEREGIPVAPIIIRHTHWQARLGHLTVPTIENANPLEDWPSADKFWGSVETGIRKQVEKLGKL